MVSTLVHKESTRTVHGDRVDSCYQSMPDSACLSGFPGLSVHDDRLGIEVHVKLPKAESRQRKSVQELICNTIHESIASLGQPRTIPSVHDIFCAVEYCTNAKVLASAKCVHSHMCAFGLDTICMLGNRLVPMFVECGSMPDAERAFLVLVCPNDYALSSLLEGYVQSGESLQSIEFFYKMQDIYPAKHTYIVLLKACASLESEGLSQKVHADIVNEGLEMDAFVGHTLIDTYGRCGLLLEAREVFDNLRVRNVVSWTALIGVYAKHGLDEEALSCLAQMQLEGLSENVVTFVCGLKACGNLRALDKGRGIHTDLIKRNLEVNVFAGNTVVDMYVKCGVFVDAWKSFDELPIRDVFSWTALIAGCAEHGLNNEALECLERMQEDGVFPNSVTYKCGLKACGKAGAICKGQQLHMELAKQGLDRDLSMENTLIDLYAKCGLLIEAQTVFNKLPARDVVTWNILIAGYADLGLGVETLSCLERMQLEGISPVASTLLCCLKACRSSSNVCQGLEIHCFIAKMGYLQDLCIVSALVGMYAKCCSFLEARFLFDDLNSHDIVVWSAMITAYADGGDSNEAVSLYAQMQEQGVCPDIVTFVSILKSCASAGMLRSGRQVHAQICSVDSNELTDVSLDTAIMDMYIKCGTMAEAHLVFDGAPKTDLVRWSALITGYAQHGERKHVFNLLESMLEQGIRPDDVLLLNVLTICNHIGLADEGVKYFEALSQRYGVALSIEHFNCLVDLFSRLGRLDEAMAMLEQMPFSPSPTTWNTLLNACKKWGEVDIGRLAFGKLLIGDEERSAAYILMSNTCADSLQLQDYE